MNKIMKVLKNVVISMGVLSVIGSIGFSVWIGNQMIEGPLGMNTNEMTKENGQKFLEQVGFVEEEMFEGYIEAREVVTIDSTSGEHTITADYFIKDGNKNKDTIILVHGYGGDRQTMYPLAKMFVDKGYNVLAYDQRNAGDNTAKYATFGYLESKDLQDCVDYLRKEMKEDTKIGILGQSMGGATVGYYAGTNHANKNVDFVILDGAINDMYEIIALVMEDMNTGLPVDYMMFCGNIATKLKLGFEYKDMNVERQIASTTLPVMVIHSKADEVCLYEWGEAIYNAVPHQNKMFYTQEDIPHIMGFYEEEAIYTSQIMTFIETCVGK